jgi:C-terminal processing protease CtpA/Prc
MMLIDEFSTSTADSVPGMFQDAHRGWLFGMRTDGAGGNNTSFDTGSYSEGLTGMTLALQARQFPVGNTGYPYTEYIENVGVWPEVPSDYMTKENLLQNGAPFIRGFLEHLAYEIRKLR